jgi:hypothetical protein
VFFIIIVGSVTISESIIKISSKPTLGYVCLYSPIVSNLSDVSFRSTIIAFGFINSKNLVLLEYFDYYFVPIRLKLFEIH